MLKRFSRWLFPLSLALVASCSGDQAPRKGQVMVALMTDMSVPKDVSVIRVKVKLGAEVRYEYDFRIAPDGEFHVPGTIAVVEGSTPTPVVTVEVIGIKSKGAGDYEPRTFAKAITTIPRERTVLLQMPVQWLCDETAVDDGTGEYLSTCAVDSKTGEETACLAGSCQSVHIDSNDLPTYNPRDVYGGGSTPTDPAGHCFDTLSCFDDGFDLTAADLDVDGDCAAEFANDGAPLNFALITSGAGDGICHGDAESPPCYVPLDQDERLGWHWDPESIGDKRKAILPQAACDALESGRASAVRATTSCETKTTKFSTCGAWSTISEPLPPPMNGSGGRGGSAGQGGTSGTDQGGAGADAGAAGDTGGQPNAGAGGADIGTGGTGGSMGKAGTAGGAGTEATAGETGAGGSSTTGGSAGTSFGGSSSPGGSAGTSSGGSGGSGPTPCPGAVTFADSGLEGIIREVLGKPTGTLLGTDVAAMTSLMANGNGISDLGGIECLVGLTSLHLNGNAITDLTPLAGLTGLTYLDVSLNQIASTAPLASLTNITQLIANTNPLTNVAGLTGINGSIDLSKSGLTDISALAGAAKATWLYLGDNQITDVSPLAGLTQLQGLDLSRNPGLNDISSLSGLVNLITFGFRTTPVTNIAAVAGMTQLIDLEFEDCAVSDFTPLTGLTAMQQLYINNTGIADLTPLSGMTNLTMLQIGNNNVTDLTPLMALPLEYLDVYVNGLTSLSPLGMITTLIHVDVANNAVNDLTPLTGLLNLSYVNAAYSYANSLQPLVDNTGLGTGDFVILTGMPLCGGQASSDIATLTGRGVTVTADYLPC
jgi:Leucine-rich repeat (LRR) protein